MKTTTIYSIAFVAATQLMGALAATKVVRAVKPTPSPSTLPVLHQLTSHGCYSSGGNLTLQDDVENVSGGECGAACKKKQFNVSGLHGAGCYCGSVYPPKDDETEDDACDYPCPGYGLEPCGSIDTDAFSIFNTGIQVAVGNYDAEKDSTTSASPTSTKASSQTSAVESSVVTESGAPSSSGGADDDEDKKPKTNVAAIAAGVVVGVVVVAAAVGGAFFFMRRRRNAEIEEEHRRNAAVNAFINGSKPPGSSGSISMTDSRLDPVMAHRRMSDGSIADNQDYSRRILRVTNA